MLKRDGPEGKACTSLHTSEYVSASLPQPPRQPRHDRCALSFLGCVGPRCWQTGGGGDGGSEAGGPHIGRRASGAEAAPKAGRRDAPQVTGGCGGLTIRVRRVYTIV